MTAPDLTERNQAHFDDIAANVQSDPRNDFEPLLNAIIAEFRERRTWIHPRLQIEKHNNSSEAEQPLALLDYACGAGTVSKALLPYTTHITGLDISPGQVAAYNAWTAREGISPERAHARHLDLLGSEGGGSHSHDHGHHHHHHHHPDEASTPEAPATVTDLKDFDVVAISMALHHVSDPAALLSRLSACLRTGSACVVLDMLPMEQQEHGFRERDVEHRLKEAPDEESKEKLRRASKTVHMPGFDEGEMRKLMEGAGLGGNMEYVARQEPFVFTMGGVEMKVRCFFARGTKIGD